MSPGCKPERCAASCRARPSTTTTPLPAARCRAPRPAPATDWRPWRRPAGCGRRARSRRAAACSGGGDQRDRHDRAASPLRSTSSCASRRPAASRGGSAAPADRATSRPLIAEDHVAGPAGRPRSAGPSGIELLRPARRRAASRPRLCGDVGGHAPRRWRRSTGAPACRRCRRPRPPRAPCWTGMAKPMPIEPPLSREDRGVDADQPAVHRRPARRRNCRD